VVGTGLSMDIPRRRYRAGHAARGSWPVTRGEPALVRVVEEIEVSPLVWCVMRGIRGRQG